LVPFSVLVAASESDRGAIPLTRRARTILDASDVVCTNDLFTHRRTSLPVAVVEHVKVDPKGFIEMSGPASASTIALRYDDSDGGFDGVGFSSFNHTCNRARW
jgi:hypothetical protein